MCDGASPLCLYLRAVPDPDARGVAYGCAGPGAIWSAPVGAGGLSATGPVPAGRALPAVAAGSVRGDPGQGDRDRHGAPSGGAGAGFWDRPAAAGERGPRETSGRNRPAGSQAAGLAACHQYSRRGPFAAGPSG